MTTQRPRAATDPRRVRHARSADTQSRPGTAVAAERKDLRTGTPAVPAVAAYIDAIPPQQRALFDRVHRLILETCPDATVVLSYKMPTYQAGVRRLHLGVWKHGVSLYGWKGQGDGGFTARHPDLQTSTGTIRIRSDAAAALPDGDFPRPRSRRPRPG